MSGHIRILSLACQFLLFINLLTHRILTNLAEVTHETAVAQTSILVYRSCVIFYLQNITESILV